MNKAFLRLPFDVQFREWERLRLAAHVTMDDIYQETEIVPGTISNYRRGRHRPSDDRWREMWLALERIVARKVEEEKQHLKKSQTWKARRAAIRLVAENRKSTIYDFDHPQRYKTGDKEWGENEIRMLVECPHCNTTFIARTANLAGRGMKCPSCGALHRKKWAYKPMNRTTKLA